MCVIYDTVKTCCLPQAFICHYQSTLSDRMDEKTTFFSNFNVARSWDVKCLSTSAIHRAVRSDHTRSDSLLQQEQHQLISRKLNCFDFPSDERINKSLTGSSCLLRWHTRKNMPLNITMLKAFDPCPPLLLLGILLMAHSSTLQVSSASTTPFYCRHNIAISLLQPNPALGLVFCKVLRLLRAPVGGK